MKTLNPYSEADFFTFFTTLFLRIKGFISGSISFDNLVSDEVQILALIGISISGALLGTFLVLKKMTMLANALSHTILIGIVGAWLIFGFFGLKKGFQIDFSLLFLAAILSSLLTTFLTEGIRKVMKLQEDASIGLVFTTLFALGILLITAYAKNQHIGLELVLGNVDGLKKQDLRVIYLVTSLICLIFFAFFKEFKLTTFDAAFARILGIKISFYHALLMVLTSFLAISAFQAVGVLMLLAFLVGPTLIARQFTNKLSVLLALSVLVGSIHALLGVALSRFFLTYFQMGLSTGGIVVCVMSLFYILSLTYSSKKRSLYIREETKEEVSGLLETEIQL